MKALLCSRGVSSSAVPFHVSGLALVIYAVFLLLERSSSSTQRLAGGAALLLGMLFFGRRMKARLDVSACSADFVRLPEQSLKNPTAS